jgi:hypothetical protein
MTDNQERDQEEEETVATKRLLRNKGNTEKKAD